jgi:hypothetical protein
MRFYCVCTSAHIRSSSALQPILILAYTSTYLSLPITDMQDFDFDFDFKGKGKVLPRTGHEGPEGE